MTKTKALEIIDKRISNLYQEMIFANEKRVNNIKIAINRASNQYFRIKND